MGDLNMGRRICETRDNVYRALYNLPEAIDFAGGSREARLLLKLREELRQAVAHCNQLLDLT